ncbi:MAG: flagellar assembly protein T N-terminal domain-containing protein [Deltaproteobacteria bacterium]
MKRLVFVIFVLGLSFMFSSFTVYAQDKVRAVGMATINKGAVDIARDKAIENAQRNAVEEKVGVMITSFSEVENFQVKIDQILSESKGFINTYTIVSEERDGDAYKVTIEADVGTGRLKDRMEAIALIMARKSKPRLMLLFSEQAQKDAVAEASMAKYFISQGFKLVDAGALKKTKGFERLQSQNADSKELSQAARRYGAEVIILSKVEVTTKSFKMGDIEVSSNEVIVSGKVVNGDTGEIIATDSKTRKGDVKVTTEDAARDLAKEIKEQIIERWSSELTNMATVKLVVFGLKSYRDLSRFKDLLAAEVKGFKQMHQRSYANGEVDLDIEVKGNAQSLADDVAAITLDRRKITILEITQNRIEAKIVP